MKFGVGMKVHATSSIPTREHRLAEFHLSPVVGQSVSSNEPIDSESQNGIPFATDKENCVAHISLDRTIANGFVMKSDA